MGHLEEPPKRRKTQRSNVANVAKALLSNNNLRL